MGTKPISPSDCAGSAIAPGRLNKDLSAVGAFVSSRGEDHTLHYDNEQDADDVVAAHLGVEDDHSVGDPATLEVDGDGKLWLLTDAGKQEITLGTLVPWS